MKRGDYEICFFDFASDHKPVRLRPAVVTADAVPCNSDASINHMGGSAALLQSGVQLYVMPIARSAPGLGQFNVTEVGKNDCAQFRNDKDSRLYDLHKIGDGLAIPSALLAQDAKPSCPKIRGEKA